MLTLDTSAFAQMAVKVAGFEDQMPFALSKALNESVKVTMAGLIQDTWPSHVNVKNKTFLRFAFGRAKMSTKRDLRVEINDEKAQGRGSLVKHADGGRRVNAKGGDLAVPNKPVKARRGASGVPKNLRPRTLPNSFRKGDVIYQRSGKYQKAGSRGAKKAGAAKGNGYDGRGLKLMYVIKRQVPIKADVPFRQDFERSMRTEFRRQFPVQMRAAIRTAFRR